MLTITNNSTVEYPKLNPFLKDKLLRTAEVKQRFQWWSTTVTASSNHVSWQSVTCSISSPCKSPASTPGSTWSWHETHAVRYPKPSIRQVNTNYQVLWMHRKRPLGMAPSWGNPLKKPSFGNAPTPSACNESGLWVWWVALVLLMLCWSRFRCAKVGGVKWCHCEGQSSWNLGILRMRESSSEPIMGLSKIRCLSFPTAICCLISSSVQDSVLMSLISSSHIPW